MTVDHLIGWVGSFTILFAYCLISWRKLESESVLYQLMNLFGATCVGINVYTQQAWPGFFLEVAWGVVAVSSLVQNALCKKGGYHV